MRCSSVDPACCVDVIIDFLCSYNFAGDHGVLIKFVNRAEPVMTVGNNQYAVRFVTRTDSRLPC
jgi:hypothetical protein